MTVFCAGNQWGLTPSRQELNFVTYKELEEDYKLVVLFPEHGISAKTVRE